MSNSKIKFSIEGSKDNPIYEAVDVHPERWNGWLCPIVTIETALKIAEDIFDKNDLANNDPYHDIHGAITEARENFENTVDVGCGLIWDEVEEVKTFPKNSWTCFDRTEVDLAGIRYTTTPTCWNKIINDDMPRLKEILGDRLYEWALDGGHTVEIPQDEIFCKEVI